VLRHCRPLHIACGLVAFQQLSGQPTVVLLSNTIFKQGGFGEGAAALSSVIVSVAKLGATVVSAQLVDRAGRRPLLLTGSLFMTAALVALGMAFQHWNCDVDVANCTDMHRHLHGAWIYVAFSG